MIKRLPAFCSALALLLGAGLAAAQPRSEPVPRLSVDQRELTFARSGDTRQLTVKNTGTAPLQVREVRLGPGSDPAFTLEPVQPARLDPGKALTVKVSYSPAGKENRQAFGNLQILSDDPAWESRSHTFGVQLVKGKSYLLTVMVFFPIVGLLCLFLFREQHKNALRVVAVIAAAVPFVLAIYLFQNFDRTLSMDDANFGIQFAHHFVWVGSFNIEYYLGVDGISVTMVLLTALVCLVAVGASFSIKKQLRGYFAMFLLLETGMMGVFCALDFFLFYVFWEVMLLPMYFLIGVWGAPPRVEADGRVRGGPYAAIKFFLYTLAGSVLMLLALIAIYYSSGSGTLVSGLPAEHTFNLMKLTKLNNFALAAPILGLDFAKLIWVALFIGFAIKIPMFPFHTWLPDAHVEAPTAISVILAGVLLKMGTYGIFRINYQLLPDATRWAAMGMAVFGVINILYGGLCAMAQKDLKKLVAYSSVSHMGFCLLGMAAVTDSGMVGAMFQMFNHGTITSMLFILVGVIYDRAHTRGVNDFGGLASVMPRYAAFFGFAFMASLGLPGLSGFISEVLVFIGAFKVFTWLVILAATGVVVTAAYHLWAIQRIHLGPFNQRWKDVLTGNDLNFREALTLVPLAVIVLVLGFYPIPIIDMVSTGMHDLVKLVAPVGAAAVAMVP
jgi:NADH-quinone oxidoreductase subunit M